MEESMIKAIEAEVKAALPVHGCHGYEHTERVYNTSLEIGAEEHADLSILLPAALLHDISRDPVTHARASAERARKILEKVNFSHERMEKVIDAISTHSFSEGSSPRTLEARILSDADKLDAMGALGIYRAAMYSEEHGRPVEDFVGHFHEKLLKLREMMFTVEARKMAESRHNFMLEFLKQLNIELNLEG